MPRVKLEYVVSFSNEDPENPASNLLAWEVSKKRWLCSKGESSSSVVLQLAKAVKIAAVHIGAYHAALVEVLVGRSEKPSEPFQVLVPSCVFLSPTESRRDEAAERVRSFCGDTLTSARDQRWDRLRLVCSQPYNKHCKYGISFIHVFEPEDRETKTEFATSNMETAPAVPSRLLNLETYSSDDDDFKPGELFAKHSKTSDSSDSQPSRSTDAQIRQANSQALKNIFGSSTKLVKTPISKPSSKKRDPTNDDHASDRHRESLLYTDDDDKPHAKIDRIVQKHNDEKNKEQRATLHARADEKYDKKHKHTPKEKDEQDFKKHKQNKDNRQSDDRPHMKTPQTSNVEAKDNSSKKGRDGHTRRDRDQSSSAKKRSHSDNKHNKARPRPGPVSGAPHTLLAGAVLALSGYANPRRAALRDAALAMGARYQRDWTPACTHLICAFPNTPKLQAVRSSAAGGACAVATAEWVERCCATRRLLPWQWFATEPSRRIEPTPEELALLDADGDKAKAVESECDTDDEIEKVLQKQKKRKRERSQSPVTSAVKADKSPSPPPDKANLSGDSVEFVCDERIQANVTVADSSGESGDSTDEEANDVPAQQRIDEAKALPELFDGCTFLIDDGAVAAGFDGALLRRYVAAYGGAVLEESQLDEDSSVDYVLCGERAASRHGARCVRADWLWRCHRERRLADVADAAHERDATSIT